jgi:hypothetical protein
MAGLAPWRDAVHDNPPKREPKYLASLITKHELMYGNDIRDVVEDTFETGKLVMVKEAAKRNDLLSIPRLDAGYILYDETDLVTLIRIVGQNWRMITFTALLYDLIPFTMTSTSSSDILNPVEKRNFDVTLEMYMSFIETIYSHHVENAYEVKRLIPVPPFKLFSPQGNELAVMLDGLPARQITEAQEKAVIYQIVENISTREEMELAITSGRFRFP